LAGGAGDRDRCASSVWPHARSAECGASRPAIARCDVGADEHREGSAHASPREFARFLQYALASVSELEGHVQLARDLELMTEHDFTAMLARIVDVRKMLHGLLKKLKPT
jgi:hypothetical protein